MKIIPIISAFLTLLIAPSLTHSEIHQWVDEKGIRHYSDKPQDNLSPQNNVTPKKEFTPLTSDSRPAKEKLRLLQGEWKQVRTSPTLDEMANLLASLWQLPPGQQPVINERDFTLKTSGSRMTITSEIPSDVIQSNTDREKTFKPKTAKIELYNDTPLEIDGFWSFESRANPIILSFLEQLGSNTQSKPVANKVRFDIQGNIMMATVYFPEEYRISTLRAIFEKIYKNDSQQ